MGKWHNAFVFNEQDETFDVYEVFYGEGRTVNPILTIRGNDVADAIVGLAQMVLDLKRGHVFNSTEEMDKHYGIKD